MNVKEKFELKLGAATREAFGKALVELGKADPNVVVCDADLSKSTFTHLFGKEFPERFFSCGIAESNMVSIGAGLASSGKIAFVSSFSAFVLNKGFEQLRVNVAYAQVPLKVVGTHSGISIGEDGPSQMSVEDLSLACSLAGFTVISPADEVATFELVKAAAYHPGPVFIRAGRVKAPILYPANTKFEIGKAVTLLEGKDLTFLSTGLLVAECIRAAEILEGEGISAGVIDIHTIKPIDREAIAKAARSTGCLVVAEEHFTDCGLGTKVAQVVCETNPCVMEFHGMGNYYAESGTPEEVMTKFKMTGADIVNTARKALARKK
ncbi:MAG: transketolase family protein [Acidobacteria bacterium]|nr:transketolase family protein [Acidobacteriota bacterium]